MVLVKFWRYPDPYQRFLIWIRPNVTDPTGSGTETLNVGSSLMVFDEESSLTVFKDRVVYKNDGFF